MAKPHLQDVSKNERIPCDDCQKETVMWIKKWIFLIIGALLAGGLLNFAITRSVGLALSEFKQSSMVITTRLEGKIKSNEEISALNRKMIIEDITSIKQSMASIESSVVSLDKFTTKLEYMRKNGE